MSPHQMVCHLGDSCRMLTGERTVRPVATPLPRPVMKWLALYLPMRWPQGIPTTPEVDQEIDGTRPSDFAADVAALEALLDEIVRRRRQSLGGQRHPMFGPMSEAAWLRWAYLHTDHHFRQFGV